MSILLHQGRPVSEIPDKELTAIYYKELKSWHRFIGSMKAMYVPRHRIEQAERYIKDLEAVMRKRHLII